MAIIAALSITILIAAATMALDLSSLYAAQSNAQRIADQSAMAAAFAYSNSADNSTIAQSAATSLATANGASGSTITTAIVTSPSGDGNKAAQVTISVPVSLSPFGKMNPGAITTSTVNATAYAEIESALAGCVIALNSTGISASGGQRLTATDCAVASGGGISASSGAVFSASAFYAVGSIASSAGASVTTTPTSGQLSPGASAPIDPYAGSGIFSRLGTVAALADPTFPSIGTTPSGGSAQNCAGTLSLAAGTYSSISASSGCTTITFTGGAGTTTNVSGYGLGPSMSSGGNVTINFGPGTYNLNGIALGGTGANFTINITGTPTINIFSNGLTLGGTSSLTVNGTATWYIQGGIANNSTKAMAFNNSNASSPSSFTIAGGGAGGIAAAHGNITFPNGTYVITAGGIYNNSTTITFGDGSFNIAGGINFQGGSGGMTFGSALNADAIFQVTSPPDNYSPALNTMGGSTLTIGRFTNVDIDGPVTIAGNANLGAAVYTVAGAFNAASTGGGSITGTNVQIIASGQVSIGQGYLTFDIEAPTSISTSTLGQGTTIAIASNSTAGATITQGATNTIVVGALYVPNAGLTLAGGGNLTGNGGCLVVDVGNIAFSGGGQISTTCSGLSASGTSAVALIR